MILSCFERAKRQREKLRDRDISLSVEGLAVQSMRAFTCCFLCVPRIKPAVLACPDKAPTNWATRQGRLGFLFFIIIQNTLNFLLQVLANHNYVTNCGILCFNFIFLVALLVQIFCLVYCSSSSILNVFHMWALAFHSYFKE